MLHAIELIAEIIGFAVIGIFLLCLIGAMASFVRAPLRTKRFMKFIFKGEGA